MKKPIPYLLVFSTCVLVVLSSAGLETMSNGAPASSTGAPGEQNCTMSGCHTSYAANTGSGIATMEVAQGTTSYEPGKTYTINVSVSQNNIDRFGFEWVALKDADSTNAGDITVTDPYRNWVVPGLNALSDRRYVTYTYAGSLTSTVGSNSWSFDWTAPSTDVGRITLYLATVAANHDGTDLGDYVYTKSVTLNSPSSTGIPESQFMTDIRLFPNPSPGNITLTFFAHKEGTTSIDLYSLSGKKVVQLYRGELTRGGQSLVFDISDQAEGIYLVGIRNGDRVTYQRIARLQ